MDHRLNVTDPPRPGVSDSLAGLPLVTLAWRALRSTYDRKRQQENTVAKALLDMADEIDRLRKTADRGRDHHREDGEIPLPDTLHEIADTLERILGRMDLEIVAPVGEPYTSERMEILESIAQAARPGIHGPIIDEVMQPAVLYRGALLRMGKAVVAWPAGQ